METAQAFMIVSWFLVRVGLVGIFGIGVYTVYTWFRENTDLFPNKEADQEADPEWEWKQYG